MHQDLTEASTCDLRYDLAGFNGCFGVQPFMHNGVMRDAGKGFQQSKSKKSAARNRLENELRMKQASAPALRELFVQLCLECPDEAAPLLGDLNLLVCMGEDMRARQLSEEQVHKTLLEELERELRNRGATDEQVSASLHYSAWFQGQAP